MKLFQVPPPAELTITVEPDALTTRETLLAEAKLITEVATAKQNQVAAGVGSTIRSHLNEVEKVRKELTAPYLAAQRTIKQVADDHCKPLADALTRVERLQVGYVQAEERKVELGRQARAAEIERLAKIEMQSRQAAIDANQTDNLAQSLMAELKAEDAAKATTAALTAHEPERQKVAGQAFSSKVLGWECTDPIALWNARPDLCNPPEPKASAIRASCAPERPVPGLRLWWESKITNRSR